MDDPFSCLLTLQFTSTDGVLLLSSLEEFGLHLLVIEKIELLKISILFHLKERVV